MIEHMFDRCSDAAASTGVLWSDLPAVDDFAPGEVPPGAELSAADWDAWIDELAAADPDRPCSAAEALAQARVDGTTFDRLGAVDLSELDADQLVALATAADRLANSAHALRARAVAALPAAMEGGLLGHDWVDARRLAAAEVGAALALGSGAADLLVDAASSAVTRLPGTMAAARRGELTWGKVVALALATAPLTDAQAAAVEARVLPGAGGRTPAQHRAMIRRWVDRVDPAGAEDRRRQAKADIELIRTQHGGGLATLLARLPPEQADLVWTAADTHARRAKAGGERGSLAQLRVAALVDWATRFLSGADEQASAPTRHGRPVGLTVVWDLSSLLGLTGHCGLLRDSDTTLPPSGVRDLLAKGARVRRLIIHDPRPSAPASAGGDPATPAAGELLDLTPRWWPLAVDDAGGGTPPVVLHLVIPDWQHHALTTGDLTGLDGADRTLVQDLLAALHDGDAAPALRAMLLELLAHPVTADTLDAEPDAEIPPAALAEFVAVRDGHPTNPTAGPSAAEAGDIDHGVARRAGGLTVRANLAALTRRWHVLKTHGGWSYRKVCGGWEWTSPVGRTYRTRPFDYRLGP